MNAWKNSGHCESSSPTWVDWPRLVERAGNAVVRRLSARGELDARELAETVVAVLPTDVGEWLARRLASSGWLDAGARVPFDVLDSPTCPADLGGGRRELVRIAVFGVPGEGQRSDSKRREAIYQQRCAEILREMRDLESLSYAAARALGHPEVHADPVLFGMLRSFIAEREAEVRARSHLPGSVEEEQEEDAVASSRAGMFKLPLRERVQTALAKLRLELEGHLVAYNEEGAAEVLNRIRDMRRRYPGHVGVAVVERGERQVAQLGEKRETFRKQLDALVQQAAGAVQRGDHKTAAWVLRRLSAVHATLPAVLPEANLETLRETILRSEEKQERHEAARRLVTREQAVGAEIKRLRAAIHACHKRLQAASGDEAATQKAAQDFRLAVDEARRHDDEWLADLMIELDCLLDDLPGQRDRAEAQVDRFVANVRDALCHMNEEIEAIRSERSASVEDH